MTDSFISVKIRVMFKVLIPRLYPTLFIAESTYIELRDHYRFNSVHLAQCVSSVSEPFA